MRAHLIVRMIPIKPKTSAAKSEAIAVRISGTGAPYGLDAKIPKKISKHPSARASQTYHGMAEALIFERMPR